MQLVKKAEESRRRHVKAYGGVDVQLHSFSTLALDRGEWSTSNPAALFVYLSHTEFHLTEVLTKGSQRYHAVKTSIEVAIMN
jgi:hypothetical protein